MEFKLECPPKKLLTKISFKRDIHIELPTESAPNSVGGHNTKIASSAGEYTHASAVTVGQIK
jgi:hypothetical protein